VVGTGASNYCSLLLHTVKTSAGGGAEGGSGRGGGRGGGGGRSGSGGRGGGGRGRSK
jgi:hypothetical protein